MTIENKMAYKTLEERMLAEGFKPVDQGKQVDCNDSAMEAAGIDLNTPDNVNSNLVRMIILHYDEVVELQGTMAIKNLMFGLSKQIDRLEAERNEARKEAERWRRLARVVLGVDGPPLRLPWEK